MVDKLKKKISDMKKDTKAMKEYVECFCESEKVNELFKHSAEFRKLKDNVKKN